MRHGRSGLLAWIAAVLTASGAARADDTSATSPTPEIEDCDETAGLSDEELVKRAEDHYERGQILYEQGDYLGAIAEFATGHCARPDPSWFYNIGQTFERLTEYEKAVSYFERFLRESDESDPNTGKARIRVEVLKKQPARITVATDPPDAEVKLYSAGALAARGIANGTDQILVTRGKYEMRIELPGYESISHPLATQIGLPQSFHFRLTPRKGRVHVTTDPREARIFIDKTLYGIGLFDGALPIGRYQLVVEAKNRPTVTRSLEVQADQRLDVDVGLPPAPRSGRWELIILSTLGLGSVTAGAFEQLFDDRVAAAVAGTGGLILGAGAAYLGVPRDVTVGTSSYFTGAAAIGAAEVTLISLFVGCDRENNVGQCDEQLTGGLIAGATAGVLFAAVTQPRLQLDAGDAAAINSGAIWGTVTGLIFYSIFEEDERIREPLVFAGLNLGVVAGATLASRYDFSRKRMALIDLAGVAGFVGGNALTRAIASNDEQVDHFSIAGVAAGLITGAYLTRNIDDAERHDLLPTIRTATDAAGKQATTIGAGWSF